MSYDMERMERMKPVLDRIPVEWGKYLPDEGWDQLLLDLDRELSEIDPDYAIHQAKEKFGSLRFYVGLSDHLSKAEVSAARGLIELAEVRSGRTCERCGAEGAKARHSGWIKTLCDDCEEKRHGAA